MRDGHDYPEEPLGEYRLLRQLGHGSFGIVYLAEHIYEHELVAIKMLQVSLTSKDAWKEFLNEARGFRLQHPHIIPLLDFGMSSDESPFLVMEYAAGGSLRERMEQEARLPLATIAAYTKQLASALQYAHSRRLIHRDVKPENMLLRADGTILLSDFGIAQILDQRSLVSGFTHTGTPAYMAPEQGMGYPCPASDQYALAVTVYEWIVGRLPFTGASMEVAIQHRLDPPPPLRAFNPAISPQVEQIVLQALAKQPEARFATVAMFAQELEDAITAIDDEKVSRRQHVSAVLPVVKTTSPSLSTAPVSANESPRKKSLPAPTAQAPVLPQPIGRFQHRRVRGFWHRLYVQRRTALLLLLLLLLAGGGTISLAILHMQSLQKHGITSTGSSTATQNTRLATPTGFPASTITPTASSTRSVARPSPTVTTGATQALAVPTGWRQVLNDPMTADNHDSYWVVDGGCSFRAHFYEQITTGSNYCAHGNSSTPTNVFGDLLYSLDLSMQKGTQAGLIFHSSHGNYYAFSIAANGTYALMIHDAADGGKDTSIVSKPSSAIRRGPGQWNTLAVIARGSALQLYINGTLVTTAADATYRQGIIGVITNGPGPQNVLGDAWFKNASVWIP